MPYQRTEKVEQKMEAREKAIIQAAREIFARDGFGGASMKSIARRAGIATGTLYLYFENKETLFQSIINDLYLELLETVKTARRSAVDTVDKLILSLKAAMELFACNKQLAELIILQAPGQPEFGVQVATMEELLTGLVRQDIGEAIEQGLMPVQDADISALAFVGSLNQVIGSWLREGNPADIRTAIEPLARYNLRALGAINNN